MLIGFRVIQGIGGAVMSSLTLSLIAGAYPPEARTGPIGLWAAVSGLAVACGSVAGGLLLSVFPWSSIFWVNVPIGIVTVVITQVAVAESREPVPRPFDTGGVAPSACGLLLTFGFVEFSDVSWHSPVVAMSLPAPLGGQARRQVATAQIAQVVTCCEVARRVWSSRPRSLAGLYGLVWRIGSARWKRFDCAGLRVARWVADRCLQAFFCVARRCSLLAFSLVTPYRY
jgi:MFS family permease